MSPDETYAGPVENPYWSDERPQIVLCEVLWPDEKKAPIPNYGTVLHQLPPNGPVTITKSANFKEKELKNTRSVKGDRSATKLDLEGFKPADVSFNLQLVSDEDYVATAKNAMEKFTVLHAAFKALDSKGRNKLFALRYPLTDAAQIEMVFFSQFEARDTEGSDLIEVAGQLKEYIPAVVTKKGGGVAAPATTPVSVVEVPVEFADAVQELLDAAQDAAEIEAAKEEVERRRRAADAVKGGALDKLRAVGGMDEYD